MKNVIEPLVGLDNIKIGFTKDAIHKILGEPESANSYNEVSQELYWHSQLQIQYGTDHKVNSIGIRKLTNEKLRLYLYGQNVFETNVNDLLEHISTQSGISHVKDYKEIPYAYVFPELGLYLWREYTPSEDMEEEEKAYYNCFEYVGIGTKE